MGVDEGLQAEAQSQEQDDEIQPKYGTQGTHGSKQA